ncbi:MAG: PaaI family thioesterase [Anaerolineales bacterium]
MTIQKQPNSSHCFVCGLQNPFGLRLRFYDNGVDEVWCDYTIPEQYQGFPGIAHGGIAAAILDEACGRISMIADPNHFMMTAKMEVKYRHRVPIEQPIRAVGKIVKQRGRLAVARAELRLADGTVAVEATMTLADVPDEFLRAEEGLLDALGWKVYD